ncbi:uncharacterized protein PgNI_09342 [Pyricularia grisea]|uniref:Uncharacterized protein n=1 Tax=Pyricularia grisea TaxID=148305 RepID=A0A6P8ASY5_PYRGI|nr:uncharacterized protein PgNI_09342 [Pyricularia grisea]TLD05236.1 hypothetical protein PgNI_09342 [Pyricularia grisea]
MKAELTSWGLAHAVAVERGHERSPFLRARALIVHGDEVAKVEIGLWANRVPTPGYRAWHVVGQKPVQGLV